MLTEALDDSETNGDELSTGEPDPDMEPDGLIDSIGEWDADADADPDALGDSPCMKSMQPVSPLQPVVNALNCMVMLLDLVVQLQGYCFCEPMRRTS